MARLAGFEPTTSASAGLRSIQLSYKRTLLLFMVPKERFELSRPYGHYALNVARLPFRHFGMTNIITLYDTYSFVNRILRIEILWMNTKVDSRLRGNDGGKSIFVNRILLIEMLWIDTKVDSRLRGNDRMGIVICH
jgi:hypothetical protein